MKANCYKQILPFIIFLSFISCKHNEATLNPNIKRIYHDRKLLLNSLTNKSLGKRDESFTLIISENNKEFVYGFIRYISKKNDHKNLDTNWVLESYQNFDWINFDSLQINKNDTSNLKKYVENQIREIYHLVSGYGIVGVNSQFKIHGIDLKLVLNDGSVVFYSKSINIIKNPEWIDYIKKANKIDENWYYIPN